MNIARSIEEARVWFLNNSSGALVCERSGRRRTVSTYDEAVAFFTEGE